MEGFFIVIVIVVGLALAAIAAYYAHQQQLKRREELARFAAGRNWRFDPEKNSAHDDLYGQFSIFTQGHTRFAYNTIHGVLVVGDALWPAVMGDYHYKITRQSGKHRTTTTYRFSYLIIETPHVAAPDLVVRSEGFFDKIAGMLGFDDIDFESAEFSDRFKVKSSDKRFAYDVLHPRMMEFLLASTPPSIELSRGQCCLFRGTHCWSPAEFEATLAWANEFFAHWPRHLEGMLEAKQSLSPEGKGR